MAKFTTQFCLHWHNSKLCQFWPFQRLPNFATHMSGRLLHLWQLSKVMPVLATATQSLPVLANLKIWNHLNQATSSTCQLWQILYSAILAKSITSCQVAKNGTLWNDITHPNLATTEFATVGKCLKLQDLDEWCHLKCAIYGNLATGDRFCHNCWQMPGFR